MPQETSGRSASQRMPVIDSMSGQNSAGTRSFFQREMEAFETVRPVACVSFSASRDEPPAAEQALSSAETLGCAIVAANDTPQLPFTKLLNCHKPPVAYAPRMGFGSRLRDARNAKGLSQEAVGTRVAVTKATISKWENEGHQPSFEIFKALCQLYEVSPNWLMEWDDDHVPADALAEARIYSRLSAEDKRRWRALRAAMFATT